MKSNVTALFEFRFWLLLLFAFLLPIAAASAVDIDWVTVGDAGNAPDSEVTTCCGSSIGTSGFGAVSYEYRIGKFEVTTAQYTEFLNAVAATDTHAVYNTLMGSATGGVTRSGSSGSFSYSVIAGRGDMPVNWVSFWCAVRFANWLHNGQPTGAQDNTTTEDGAYTLTPDGNAANSITRNPGGTVFVTSEDEWYKAAYYKGGGTNAGYWNYPTASDTWPVCTAPGATVNTANCNLQHGDLTDVGSYTGSASPSGTFDQAGNLWEWNDVSISGPPTGVNRGLRDSNYAESPTWGHAAIRRYADPRSRNFRLGFRLVSLDPASTPIPSMSLLGKLMLCSLLGLASYRMRHA